MSVSSRESPVHLATFDTNVGNMPDCGGALGPSCRHGHTGRLRKRFKVVYAIVATLAVYQLCISSVSTADARSAAQRRAFLAGALALLLPLLFLPWGAKEGFWVRRERHPHLLVRRLPGCRLLSDMRMAPALQLHSCESKPSPTTSAAIRRMLGSRLGIAQLASTPCPLIDVKRVLTFYAAQAHLHSTAQIVT